MEITVAVIFSLQYRIVLVHQVPGIFLPGSETLHQTWKPGIYFHSPGYLQNRPTLGVKVDFGKPKLDP